MPNPLFNQFGNFQQTNDMSAMFKQISEFEKMYKGDAKAQVEQMVSSGIIPQNVFNELAQQANQIMSLLSKK